MNNNRIFPLDLLKSINEQIRELRSLPKMPLIMQM